MIANIYVAGFLITAMCAVLQNSVVGADERIPPLGVFLGALLWPVVWALNVAIWILQLCRR